RALDVGRARPRLRRSHLLPLPPAQARLVPGLPFSPPTASRYPSQINLLFGALLIVGALTAGLVFFLMLFFANKYRHGSNADRSGTTKKTWRFEVSWTAATLLIFVGLAVWGADIYLHLYNPPANAVQIFVVGKQWMWKAQHPGGQREINALHVPVGQPIRLVLASQDVIHSFFIPALRIKQDVVPGRYETMWFRADKVGRYHLFCAEYCGTDHAHMGGWITVMEPRDFGRWLQAQGGQETLAAQGKDLFRPNGRRAGQALVPRLRLQRVPRGRRDGARAAARGRVREPGAAFGRKRGHRRRALR